MSTQSPSASSAPAENTKKCCPPECDILLWKNPIETGKIFGGALVALLILKKVNLITFFLRVFYTIFLTTGSIEFLSKLFLGQGLITKYGIKDCPNTVGYLKPHIDCFLKQLPVKQAKMRKLVFAYSPKKTFHAAFTFYLLHKLFSWFSVWTLLFVGVIAAFTSPLTYCTYQKEIDAVVEHLCQCAKAKSNEVCKLACEKSKPLCDKLEKKCGPLCKFIKAKLPASTGATTTSTITPESTTAKLASQVPIENDDSTATTTSANVHHGEQHHASTGTKEFDVDQLTSELKESTNNLKQELQDNNL
ncbi:hypothetical protein NCAS_0B02670 [Naumovozyma castellii]|uniref:Reticulon-like protein n=1 Tax=Naumovozyma castellii TaxID=27288 RepID=G0VBM5_NAUCA|nr:hypothetical protein NCAS_0B02670 [Naumovozyma castellii CBS 4309]CCC68351.1 hypothetical protein NCAS_0B02670 [Naumovozyma castellii CBS 4309]